MSRAGAVLFCSAYDDPQAWAAALRRHAPALEVRVWPETGEPEDIEAALVWKPPEGALRRFPNLRLIVNLGAGVDHITADRTLPEGVPIVRLVDPGMTQLMVHYVLAAVLRYHRDFDLFEREVRAARWTYVHPRPAATVRVGVAGLGHLGGAVARELARQGFTVAGWARSPRDLEGIETFAGRAALPAFLARTDLLVLLLPRTRETRGLIDAAALAALPRGARLINAGRGEVLDEAALLAALDRGQIAAATLDVFEREPLPAEHPFWRRDDVLVTPHLASVAVPETAAAQVVENLRRLRHGLPLLHPVDPARGY